MIGEMPEAPLVGGGPNFRAILAVKIKRLRKARGLTLTQLARGAGLSPSYLAEIESGRKYPKPDRLLELARALDCSFDELTSTRLENGEDTLYRFLNARGIRDFPFETFGLPSGDVIKLLTRSPTEIAALIRTLTDMARQYDISFEHFVNAAFRSYQELTGNYYEALEERAEAFAESLKGDRWDLDRLRSWVRANCGCVIDETTLGKIGALRHFRSVYVRAPPRLLLNPALSDSQKAFLLAREAGYLVLGGKIRAWTAPPQTQDTFEQVRNDFEASYFAGAFILPRKRLIADLEAWLGSPVWDPDALPGLLDRYQVTPQALVHRLSQLLPSLMGLPMMVLKFEERNGSFRLSKQLNLTRVTLPVGFAATEHYCRRLVSMRVVGESRRRRRRKGAPPATRVAVEFVQLIDADQRFFCIGLAMPEPLQAEVVSSFLIAFPVDDHFMTRVRFAADKSIPGTIVGTTCERCRLAPAECRERVALPLLYEQGRAAAEQQHAVRFLGSQRMPASAARQD